MEDETSGTTHDLLLALAGRVDDDLLAWARELVAVGEDARAVELVTAALAAAGTVLPTRTRAALVTAARSARTDLDAGSALRPPMAEDDTEHRFTAPAEDDPVAAALRALPARPLAGSRVQLARRLTPAGSAPGPLPHPVVLVQVRRGDRPADVLAYQLAVALERAGTPASVEVLTAGRELSPYHAAALASAVAVRSEGADDRSLDGGMDRGVDEPSPRPAGHWREPEAIAEPARRDALDAEPTVEVPARQPTREPEEAGYAETFTETTFTETATARLEPDTVGAPHNAERGDIQGDDQRSDGRMEPDEAGRPIPEPLSPHPLAPPRPLPVREEPHSRPMPRPVPTHSGGVRRPTVTPISRAASPNPIPLARRNGPPPVARPLVPVTEPVPPQHAPTPDERPADTQPRRDDPRDDRPAEPVAHGETPAFNTLSDPLSGPLKQPLLDPLLDPTFRNDDSLGVDDRRPERTEEPAAPAKAEVHGGKAGTDDEWSAEWLSGRWAMQPSAIDGDRHKRPGPAGGDRPADDRITPAPRPTPRPVARHRYAEDRPEPTDDGGRADPEHNGTGAAEFGPDEHGAPRPADAGPETASPERASEASEFGLRPDAVARLSDADRQLLARLQAELLGSRRPRNGRRPPNGAGPNGNHRAAPPDLAG